MRYLFSDPKIDLNRNYVSWKKSPPSLTCAWKIILYISKGCKRIWWIILLTIGALCLLHFHHMKFKGQTVASADKSEIETREQADIFYEEEQKDVKKVFIL